MAEASAEAERVRAEATREGREAAEAAAGQALQTEIARVRADTEHTLAAEFVKLRSEEDERRKRELAEITAQVAQLKDAAAEQAKAAAAQALQSELDRVRQATVVQERVIRLAPPPVEPAVAPPVAQVEPASEDASAADETADSPETSTKDYYSLWQTDDTDGEPDEAQAATPRKTGLRQILFGGAAAACILVGVMLGTGGSEQDPTGYILIDSPPGAQVWVEGTLIGETPLPEISAGVGEHEVVVIHPDAGEVRQTVTVDADSSTILTLVQ